MNEYERMSTFTIASSSTDSNCLLGEESSPNQPYKTTRRQCDCILLKNSEQQRSDLEYNKEDETNLFSKYFKSEIFQKIFLVGSNIGFTKSVAKTSNAASETLRSIECDDDDEYQTIRPVKKISKKQKFLSVIMRKCKKENTNRNLGSHTDNDRIQAPSKRGINRVGGHLVGARLAPHHFQQSELSITDSSNYGPSIQSNLGTINSESESTINIYHSELSQFSILTPRTSTVSMFDDEDSHVTYHSYLDDSKSSLQTSRAGIPKPKGPTMEASPESLLGKCRIENDDIEPDLFESGSDTEIGEGIQGSHSQSVSSLHGGRKAQSLGLHHSDNVISTGSSTGSFRRRFDRDNLSDRIAKETINAVKLFIEKKYDEAKSHFESLLRNKMKITGPYSLEVATIHEYIGECIYKQHIDDDDMDGTDENTIDLFLIKKMILHYVAALRALHVKLFDNETIIKIGDLLDNSPKNVEGEDGDKGTPASPLMQLLKTKDGDLSSEEKLPSSERPQAEKRMIARLDKRLTSILFI